MTRRLLFRIVNGALMAPLFALSVAVQYNDPDPIRWMLIYGAAMALCIAVAIDRPRWLLVPAGIVAVIAAVWAATQVPSLVNYLRSDHQATTWYMKTGDSLEEEARECGGLLIVTAWSLVVAFARRKRG